LNTALWLDVAMYCRCL